MKEQLTKQVKNQLLEIDKDIGNFMLVRKQYAPAFIYVYNKGRYIGVIEEVEDKQIFKMIKLNP